jgi:hypothetical protein
VFDDAPGIAQHAGRRLGDPCRGDGRLFAVGQQYRGGELARDLGAARIDTA